MDVRHYVVQTKPMAEQIAEAELKRQGFVCYLPTLTIERRNPKGKVFTVLEPLFPSYLFVELDLKRDRWRAVNGTRGVKCLLGDDPERPTAVPRGTIEALMQAFAQGKFESTQIDNTVRAGDFALIEGGAFAGHVGKCIDSRAGRVKLLLSLLGGAVTVRMPSDLVRRETAA